MALMMGDLYAALIAAGASEEKGRAAAIEAAAYRSRPRLAGVPMVVLKGMTGVSIVLTFIILLKVFLK